VPKIYLGNVHVINHALTLQSHCILKLLTALVTLHRKEGYGRNRSWSIVRYYDRITPDGLRKRTKHFARGVGVMAKNRTEIPETQITNVNYSKPTYGNDVCVSVQLPIVHKLW
jgi:hypothetical protein